MLELRPNCENCDCDLPPDSEAARICTYECTFCANCVEHKLQNVCPNCGGGFQPRPIRPAAAHRPGISLKHQPAGVQRQQLKYTQQDIQTLVDKLKNIPPAGR